MFLIKRIKRKKSKEYKYNKINKFMLTNPYYINSFSSRYIDIWS